jgi:hypothetical protein
MPIVRVNMGPMIAAVMQIAPKASDKGAIVRQLGASAMQFWKAQAQGLRSSSRDYVQGLSHNYAGEVATITLGGTVPNMIENGWVGGDMRDWLLKGPNAKPSKDGGMFNTVPFRHGMGGAGRNVGPAMPQPLRSPASRLAPTLSRPGMVHGVQAGQHVVYGQRLSSDVFRMSKQAKEILETESRPWHASSIYVGMIRQEKVYEKAKQSQYTTFRRISKVKRGPKHWMHRGIKARKFAVATQQHVEGISQSIMLGVLGR